MHTTQHKKKKNVVTVNVIEMQMLIIQISLLVTGGVILGLLGLQNPFSFIYLAPIGFGSWLLRNKNIRLEGAAFSGSVAAFELFFTCAWALDWWETATASSTSSLIMAVVPFLAIGVAGIVYYFVAFVIKAGKGRIKATSIALFLGVFLTTFLCLSIISEYKYRPKPAAAGSSFSR